MMKTIRNSTIDKKIEPQPRENYSFKQLVEDNDEFAFEYDGKTLFSLSTQFDINKYYEIFEKYKDREYEIILEDGQPIIENGEPLRDYTNTEIRNHNKFINKIRTVEMLRLMANHLNLPEDDKKAVQILDNLGDTLVEQLSKKIQEVIVQKLGNLKERKNLNARKLLAFSPAERLWLNQRRKEMGLPISNSKYTEPIDGRKIESGISNEYVILCLAKEYGWSNEFIIRVLENDLTEKEECLIELMKAKYSLDCEREERMHKEIEEKQKNT